MTPEECMTIYGQAWFEPDHAQRVEILRRCCTEDIRFADAGALYNGLDEVSGMIGATRSSVAGAQGSSASATGRSGGGVSVEVTTPIETFGPFFRYSFVWHMPDGSFGGTDFGEFAEDGRMKVITVWGASRHFPVPGV